MTIKHTAYDTTALTTQALLAGQQGKSPDILLVDNPVVSTLASAGILTTTAQNGLSTGAIAQNILGAGVINGKTYGVPIGANTLALYYNPKILKAAKVRPGLHHELGHADRGAGQGQGDRQEGHHLLRHQHRGRQLPVPAVVLGGRSEPDQPRLAPGGRRADAVDHLDQGRLRAELGDPEHADHVVAGVPDRRLRLRRERHLAEGAAPRTMGAQVIPIPAENGGAAPVPTGGEFFTIPVQKDTSTYATSAKIVSACRRRATSSPPTTP